MRGSMNVIPGTCKSMNQQPNRHDTLTVRNFIPPISCINGGVYYIGLYVNVVEFL